MKDIFKKIYVKAHVTQNKVKMREDNDQTVVQQKYIITDFLHNK